VTNGYSTKDLLWLAGYLYLGQLSALSSTGRVKLISGGSG